MTDDPMPEPMFLMSPKDGMVNPPENMEVIGLQSISLRLLTTLETEFRTLSKTFSTDSKTLRLSRGILKSLRSLPRERLRMADLILRNPLTTKSMNLSRASVLRLSNIPAKWFLTYSTISLSTASGFRRLRIPSTMSETALRNTATPPAATRKRPPRTPTTMFRALDLRIISAVR